jgi:hypothetical protein
VIVDDIEDDLDPSAMQLCTHISNLFARAERVRSRIVACMRRKKR